MPFAAAQKRKAFAAPGVLSRRFVGFERFLEFRVWGFACRVFIGFGGLGLGGRGGVSSRAKARKPCARGHCTVGREHHGSLLTGLGQRRLQRLEASTTSQNMLKARAPSFINEGTGTNEYSEKVPRDPLKGPKPFIRAQAYTP